MNKLRGDLNKLAYTQCRVSNKMFGNNMGKKKEKRLSSLSFFASKQSP